MKTESIKLHSHSAAIAAAAQAALQPTAAQAIAAKVDRLGVLHAAQAEMKREADHLRAELEDAGLTDIKGQLYRVNFAQVAGRTLTDWRAIAERLKPSPQLVRAHTTTGQPSTRLTIKARQTHYKATA